MTTVATQSVPTGWEEIRVANLGEVVAGGTPTRNNSSYWNGDIPWATPSEITRLHCKYLSETAERITAAGLAGSAARLLPEKSIVVTTRATLGEAAITTCPLATNQGFKNIVPNVSTDPLFTYYKIKTLRGEMERLASGTTFLEISKADFEEISFSCPKLAEQERIGLILDTLDTSIEQTEALTAKLKQVRAGLLHDLMTRGVDENGEVRDPFVHPSAFKDSAMGKIPISWSVEKLGERLARCRGHIQTGPFGSQLHASDYVAGGVPVVMPQDIDEGAVTLANIACTSYAKANELSRHKLKPADLIFSRRGDLGRCAVVGARESGWLCGTGCLLMRFEQTKLMAGWLSLAYQHDSGQRQIAARAVGTTMANLNTDLLNHLVFAFPPIEEQEMVVSVAAEAGKRIAAARDELAKLKMLRAGLTDDLLTGIVRVPEALDERELA